MEAGDFTIGVEEEFLIVDPASRRLLPAAEQVLAKAGPALGDHVHAELHLSQLETSTEVCQGLEQVRAELCRLRRGAAAAASEAGAGVAAAGTHPCSHWSQNRITPRDAYLALERDYQHLAREQVICGCHVHIGMADRETAIQVMNHVRPWLSTLLALTGNSPFWLGADTGYSSYRTEIWRRWPLAGEAGIFASRAEYDALVETLVATGSIDAPARIYWDVRPSAQFDTLEFRVSDVCLTVDEAVMVAGLVRGLARAAHQRVTRDEAVPRPRPELLKAATWRAARYGVRADLIHVEGRRSLPAAQAVGVFLDFVRPALEEFGDWEQVNELAQRTLGAGTGADRQRAAMARSGRWEDVVDLVLAETTSGTAPGRGSPAPEL